MDINEIANQAALIITGAMATDTWPAIKAKYNSMFNKDSEAPNADVIKAYNATLESTRPENQEAIRSIAHQEVMASLVTYLRNNPQFAPELQRFALTSETKNVNRSSNQTTFGNILPGRDFNYAEGDVNITNNDRGSL